MANKSETFNKTEQRFKSKNKINDYLEPTSSTWWPNSFGMAGLVVTDHILERARASFTISVCYKGTKFIFSTFVMIPLTTFFI